VNQIRKNFPENSQLVSYLNRIGVEFLMSEEDFSEKIIDDSKLLIVGLACNHEARLRLALIPLFLQKPEIASILPLIVDDLPVSAQITLQCYYCASFYLQRKFKLRLKKLFGSQPLLPPLFIENLGLQTDGDPEENLKLLAQKHQLLTGRLINWYGTYEHAVQRLLVNKEKETI